jgi:hypothetical protein
MHGVAVLIQALKNAALPTPPIELKTLNGVVTKKTPTPTTRYSLITPKVGVIQGEAFCLSGPPYR